MPYRVFQGGRMRRRRRRGPVVLAVVALLAAGASVAGALRGAGRAERTPRPPARAAAVPPAAVSGALLGDAGTAPLAGGGAIASPLAVRLADPRDAVRARFRHPPRSGLLFDLGSGRVLWRRDPTRVLPIASLTKIMTALLVAERIPRGAKVPITREALAYQGSGVGVLPKGRRVDVEALLYGLLLPSGNDAAIALAQRAGGTVPRFVALMNDEARRLGLACTRFSTPSGFLDRGNHSCASDLAAMARALLRVPRLARIVGSRRAVLRFPIRGHHLYLYNNNPLLAMGYRGTTGVKTGYTEAAGRCLVATARRGSRRLGVVLLASPDPGGQARRLLDRGFAMRR